MEPEGYDNGERREQRIHRLLLPCRYDRREAREDRMGTQEHSTEITGSNIMIPRSFSAPFQPSLTSFTPRFARLSFVNRRLSEQSER